MVLILNTLTVKNIKIEYFGGSCGVIKVISHLFIHFLFFGGGGYALAVVCCTQF